MGGNLVGTLPRFQSAVTHLRCEPGTWRRSTYFTPRNVRIRSARRDVERHCKWIERILNRYTNALGAADPKGSICIREYVRPKWRRRLDAFPETTHVFEVGKQLQILVANFVVE